MLFVSFFYFYCISNSLFMGILYKRYFGSVRLLGSLEVKENPGTRALRRLGCVVHANIRGQPKNLLDLSLIGRG